jgi:poly(A) polymerase
MQGQLRQLLQTIDDLVPESYVVGGAIRDRLLGLHPIVDLDVAVLGDGLDVAGKVCSRSGTAHTLVPLHAQHGVARIVLHGREPTIVDISRMKGDSIKEDLAKRDFTINAIAVALRDFIDTGLDRMIDPRDGAGDLRRKSIRACSSTAFLDDPLRILRAFRFSALLDFQITADTLAMIPPQMDGLLAVAGERVRDEFVAILAAEASFATLKAMDSMGILELLFPELTPCKGCAQNVYHHLDVWDHSLETVRLLERKINQGVDCFGEFYEIVEEYLKGEPVIGRSRKALLKFAALFHDSGKPRTRFVDAEGRIRFFGHEKISADIVEKVARRWRFAARETRTIANWVSGHMRAMIFTGETVSNRAVRRLHKEFGGDVTGLLVLFLADLGASRGPARAPRSQEKACNAVRSGLQACADLDRNPFVPLLKGRDLMKLFGLEPGPRLGEILKQIQDLQITGDITTRDEAVRAAEEILRH